MPHRLQRATAWTGYVVVAPSATIDQIDRVTTLRLYERPPALKADQSIHSKEPDAGPEKFGIKQLKEHDLIFMSDTPLRGHGDPSFDFKSIVNLDFLRANLLKPSSMLALVSKKATTSFKSVGPAELKVDVTKGSWLDRITHDSAYCKMYCYHFESLATTLREYRTLKMSEFFRMSPILVHPKKASENERQRVTMLEEHKKSVQAAIKSAKMFTVNKFHAEAVAKMRRYAHRNRKLFNASQKIVLDRVIDMPENDILLI